MKSDNKPIPMIDRRATFVPETINKEKRTIDVVWSTGAKVKRGGLWSDPFYEELSMKKDHVRLDRLNAGAPLLNNHNNWDLRDVIGVVEKASVVSKEGKATVRFSEREDVGPLFNDVASGIIRNISVGYRVHKFEEVEGKNEGDLKTYRAVDWEPMELSFVAIPADAGAQVRNSENLNLCTFVTRGDESMSEPIKTEGNAPVKEPVQPTIDQDKLRNEAIEEERKRTITIKEMVRKVNLEESFADKMIEDGVSLDDVRGQIIEKLAEKQKDNDTRSSNVTVTKDENETRVRCAKEAILNRANSARYEMTEGARKFANHSMLDMAREFCEAHGINTREMTKMELVGRAFHSTSDFPYLLADVANKTLRDAYAEAPETHMEIAREITLPDFKELSRTQIGDGPELDEVLESGEVTYGTVGEAAEKIQIKTYAKALSITRKAIINDDLDAFSRIPSLFGRRARQKEADLVWAIITGNPDMYDSVALFHADHGNLASSGATIDVTTLGAGRLAMRTQTGIDGATINITPRKILVPAALETKAEQIINTVIVPATDSNANPFKGTLKVVAEPRLDATSATAWFLAASPSEIDIIELARLQGESGPVIETQEGFEIEGMKMKVRIDVGVKAIDWRGVYKNPGA